MNISRNTLLAAVVTLTSIAAASQVQACKGGRGGGYSGGFSGGYSSSSYGGYNSYRAPAHNYTPSYSTPNYYSQPQPVIHRQPVQQQFVQQAPQTVSVRPVQQVSQQQAVAPQPQVAPQQQIAQAPQIQPAPQQQPVQQLQAQVPANTQNAQMSALQALGGFAPPAMTPAPAPQQQQVQTPAHVGTWTATLGNGATVRLSLQADGNFNWVATNKTGSQSSFSGSYTVSNGSLTLNRSNDGQKLGGNMTISGNNAFSFKVAGNNAASINFSRS